jgi:hypothetical protein
MLTPDERALLRKYCHEHPVATCPQCSDVLALDGLGTDIIIGRRDFCPTCRTDLTPALRLHLVECTVMRAQAREIRNRAQQMEPNGRGPSERIPHLQDDVDEPEQGDRRSAKPGGSRSRRLPPT